MALQISGNFCLYRQTIVADSPIQEGYRGQTCRNHMRSRLIEDLSTSFVDGRRGHLAVSLLAFSIEIPYYWQDHTVESDVLPASSKNFSVFLSRFINVTLLTYFTLPILASGTLAADPP